jgi:hypothetical protein
MMTDASCTEEEEGQEICTVQIPSKNETPLRALTPWVEKKKNEHPSPGDGKASKVISSMQDRQLHN